MAWLLIFCLLNVAVDFHFTRRRMNKYGAGVELTPSLRFFNSHFGLTNGLLLSLVMPQTVIAVVLWVFSPIALAFFSGMCFWRSYGQFLSLRLEREIDKVVKRKMGP